MSKELDSELPRTPNSRLDSNDLFPAVYLELRRIARHQLRREPHELTLQATALVHEAFLRMAGNKEPGWQSRAHFFGAASEAMRRVLIDHARSKQRGKRQHGGQLLSMQMESLPEAVTHRSDELLLLDVALTKLERMDRLKAELVKLKFFGGLSIQEASRVLGISTRTGDRYWAFARAWLHQEMTMATQDDSREAVETRAEPSNDPPNGVGGEPER